MPIKSKTKLTQGSQSESYSEPVSSVAEVNSVAAQGNKKIINSGVMMAVLGVLIVAGIAAYFAHAALLTKKQLLEAQNALKQYTQTNATQNQDDPSQLIAQVGKLVILPADETPTIATVTDLAKLQGQPFFANAQVGDKVLIYAKAGKAVLYRPSENKVIELAPLNTGGSSAGSASALLSVEIRNGTGKSGVAQNFKTILLADGEFSVTKLGNAHGTYPNSVLYVSSENKKGSAAVTRLEQIATAAPVSVLPLGELPTTADAVLILGKQ